ncbi:MAG TPA: sugar phosphate nucleotidyltransferase [Patescibacteria group bacterium]|nr:sugar phosphate nucleotidyltransferase [Patescibacteria group bacterium]
MKIVLFAGGVGSRLWPLSRKNTPKQFGKIIADRSMLQIAVHKLFPDFSWDDVYISTGMQYEEIIRAQLPDLPAGNIIVEPEMRDVGPAVGLVIAQFMKKNPDEPIVLLWGSDHLVKEEALFRKILKAAGDLIAEDPQRIVFIGQKPRFANQNVGYIEYGREIAKKDGFLVHAFSSFKYSPPFETAKEYANDGKHAWNLGYFATTPRFLWQLFEQYSPELFEKVKKIYDSIDTPAYEKTLREVYPTIEKISFDHAILEKMNPKYGCVMAADIGWSDIGAWEAMKEALSETVDANVTKGKIILESSRDSLVHNDTEQLIVGIDLDGLVVVSTEDVLLICPKNSVPKIKQFVASLKGTENEHLT